MNKIKKRYALIYWVMLVYLVSPVVAKAQTAREIAQKTFPSVVLLAMEDANGQPISLGSGFFIREGVIATNLHVIEGAYRGYAKLVGQKTKFDIAGITALDENKDLVLLSIEGSKATSLTLGDSNQMAVGDEVYAVGNPQGLEGTFSQGIVSGIRQVGQDSILQITAPISPGSSGGPVLNSKGEVVGVSVATFKGGQNLNFAIPANYLKALLEVTGSLKPFKGIKKKATEQSITGSLGGRSIEGIVGGQLTWNLPGQTFGWFSFSLRNLLREDIRNVRLLIVFYDSKGNPIDVKWENYQRVSIPAGLAKRFKSRVDGSVQPLTERGGSVEFRILDFQIIESR